MKRLSVVILLLCIILQAANTYADNTLYIVTIFPEVSNKRSQLYASPISSAFLKQVHNQIPNQSSYTEPNLHTCSSKQLSAYFDAHKCSPKQILQRHDLYSNPEFIKVAKTCAGYEEHITKLHSALQNRNDFIKVLYWLVGKHPAGLTNQVRVLHHEMVQAKRTIVRARHTDYIEHQYQEQRSDWGELCTVYQDYACGTSEHIGRLDRRIQALEDVKQIGVRYADRTYHISSDVVRILSHGGYDVAAYQSLHASQLQHALHQECIDLLTHVATIPKKSLMHHHEPIVTCIDAARAYNAEGLVQQASAVTDLCWALLDYGSAIVEGAVVGVVGAVQDIIEHPIHTAACVVAGQYVLAYQLGKVLTNVADISITALFNTSRAQEKLHDYIAPVTKIVHALENKEITLRDALKTGTAIGVGLVAQHKLLGGLHKLYSGIKTHAVAFTKSYPTASPQEYIQTPEGLLLRASVEPPPPNTNLALSIAENPRVLLEALQESVSAGLKPELGALRSLFDNTRK